MKKIDLNKPPRRFFTALQAAFDAVGLIHRADDTVGIMDTAYAATKRAMRNDEPRYRLWVASTAISLRFAKFHTCPRECNPLSNAGHIIHSLCYDAFLDAQQWLQREGNDRAPEDIAVTRHNYERWGELDNDD
jgi:hypothetical protein